MSDSDLKFILSSRDCMSSGDDLPSDTVTSPVVRDLNRTKKPYSYKVLLLNDDYTPMDFVVHILERFFGKDHDESVRIMLHVHTRGVGVCGIYSYEVAETKVSEVMDFSRLHEHPLQCCLERI